MPSLSLLRFTSAMLAGSFLLSQTAYATQEENVYETMTAAIRTLRVQNEETESTESSVKSLKLYHIKSLSFPVTWAFDLGQGFQDPNIMLSKKLSAFVANAMVYKPTTYANGVMNLGAPLSVYFASAYGPLIPEDEEGRDFHTVYVQPILPSKNVPSPLNAAYIDFCSYKPIKSMNRTIDIVTINNLAELETRMKSALTFTYDGDSYVPSVYVSEVKDAEFMGLPAKKLTMVFDSSLDRTTKRRKYEGVYALKNGYVVCAEVLAPEESFDSVRPYYDAMVASIVPTYEFLPVGQKSSAASSAKSMPATTMPTPKIPASCRAPKQQKLKRCARYYPGSSSSARAR